MMADRDRWAASVARGRLGRSARRLRGLVLLAVAGVVAACSGGRFIGPVTAVGGVCAPPARGVLLARSGQFLFTPDEGVLTVRGTLAPDGSLRGSGGFEGRGAQGESHALTVTFDGRIVGDRVEGTLHRPGCTQTVSLTRN